VPRDGRDCALVTRLQVNGKSYDVATHPSAALLWALRDEIGCSSVKYGCGSEQCGACRVLIDRAPAYSCAVTIADAAGRDITTLESLLATGAASRVVDAMASINAGQCGYCLPGIVLALTVLGAANPSPSRADVVRALDPHLCRCGSHGRILAAAYQALEAPDG
jgi:nicotinate dehydrogenase subunit A